jgi:hypothetical protein
MGRQLTTLLRPPFSQTFPIKILRLLFCSTWLKVLKIRYLRVTTPPPTALWARVISYALGAYKIFIESVVVETSKWAHSIGK